MALQTKTFTAGSTTSSELNYYALDLVLTEESTNAADNSSTISYELRLRSGNISFSLFGLGASISLDGKVVATRNRYSAPQMSMSANSTLVILSGSTKVTHDDSGNKSMSVAYSINMEKSSVTPGPVSVSGKTMTLTAIARESTAGASDANIGARTTIVVTRRNAAYTHSIAYRFGTLTGYITADGDISAAETKFTNTTVSWAIPTAFYAQIPNSKTGKCTLTVRTYSGSTQIGIDRPSEFTVTASEAACKPSVSGTVVDTNEVTKALTGDETKLVRYCSTALCTITASAKNSASIREKKIGGTTVSEDSIVIPEMEAKSITFFASDSRGYEASFTVSPTLIPYIMLTSNVLGERTHPTNGNARINVKGNYFNDTFGAESNSLTVKYRVDNGQYETVIPTISENEYQADIELTGLDYEQQHRFEVEVSDKIMAVSKSGTIKKGIPLFDWGQNDFSFHVPVSAQNINGIQFIRANVDGTRTITIQSRFSDWDTVSNDSRHTIFIFGSANSTSVYGVLTISRRNSVKWAGTDGVTATTGDAGKVTVTMPETAWDRITFISAYETKIL